MKRIVVCCDGTWDKARSKHPTNVAKTWLDVEPEGALTGDSATKSGTAADGVEQVVFYEAGVGTTPLRFFGPLVGLSIPVAVILAIVFEPWTGVLALLFPFALRFCYAAVPGIVGSDLETKIKNAYRFIALNYAPGDELYFFGFSRGAFTARSTAGMVRKCGILWPGELRLLGQAFRLYKNPRAGPDGDEARLFRVSHSANGGGYTPIKFVGVWDTVGALGVPVAGLTTRVISVFRGLWELLAAVPGMGWVGARLAPFFISIEGLPVLGSILHEFMPGYYRFHDVALSSWVENACQALAIDEHRKAFGATLWEQRPGVTAPDAIAVKTGAAPPAQHLEQRWYAGVHRDIGGGQPDSRQSDRTRLWMSRKAAEAGLVFNAAAFHDLEARVAADDPADAPLGDTFRNLYRIIAPPYFRPIGEGVPPNQATYFGGLSHEVVDESVPARHKGDPEYHPANVIAYYRTHPIVAGGGVVAANGAGAEPTAEASGAPAPK